MYKELLAGEGRMPAEPPYAWRGEGLADGASKQAEPERLFIVLQSGLRNVKPLC
jgi:hypothetical protein